MGFIFMPLVTPPMAAIQLVLSLSVRVWLELEFHHFCISLLILNTFSFCLKWVFFFFKCSNWLQFLVPIFMFIYHCWIQAGIFIFSAIRYWFEARALSIKWVMFYWQQFYVLVVSVYLAFKTFAWICRPCYSVCILGSWSYVLDNSCFGSCNSISCLLCLLIIT